MEGEARAQIISVGRDVITERSPLRRLLRLSRRIMGTSEAILGIRQVGSILAWPAANPAAEGCRGEGAEWRVIGQKSGEGKRKTWLQEGEKHWKKNVRR